MGWGEFPGSRVHTDGKHKEVYGRGRETAQKIWVRGGIVTGRHWEGDPKGGKPFRLNRRDSRLQKLLEDGGDTRHCGTEALRCRAKGLNPGSTLKSC